MGVPSQKLRSLSFPLRIRGIKGVTFITPLSPSYLKRGIFKNLPVTSHQGGRTIRGFAI